jgi:hypothetical protein
MMTNIAMMIQFVIVLVKKPVPVKYINFPCPRESGWDKPIIPWKCAIEVDYRKEARLEG